MIAAAAPTIRGPRRRGMLLVVALLIITLLAMLGASFAFQMNAQLAGVTAERNQQQARLAAESGIDRAISILREQRTDMDSWYNNPNAFRRMLVWAPDRRGGSESIADQEAVPGRPAWRFSLVSYRLEGSGANTTAKIRYGITDEAGKVNINVASRAQLLALFDQVKYEDVTSEELADALIDWRDQDDKMVSVHGAEGDYYRTLNPPYAAKNRMLESVEELLMVKGFNGRILYGEDYNRNGYLDANEDDGRDGAFPPDDGDGQLNRGLLPLITVYSWDWNLCNDNKHRVDLNMTQFKDVDKLPAHIVEELSPQIIEFIAEAQKRGYRFRSVGELMGLEVYEDGSSNYDSAWRQYIRQIREAGRVRQQELQAPPEGEDEDQQGEGGDGRGQDGAGDQRGDEGRGRDEEDRGRDERDGGERGREEESEDGRGTGRRSADDRDQEAGRGDVRRDDGRPSGGLRDEEDGERRRADDKNEQRRNQSIRGNSRGGQSGNSFGTPGGNRGGANSSDNEDDERRGGRGRDERDEEGDNAQPPGGRDSDQGDENGGRPRGRGRDGDGRFGEGRDSRDETGRDGGAAAGPGARGRGTPVVSPVTPGDLAVIMDRLTVTTLPAQVGLINVNTASVEVLKSIPGITPEEAESIVAKREGISGLEKATPAWLMTTGAIDPVTFALISNQITTRSIQFTIDSIGFADHVGTVKRIQAVVEMRGQLAQIKYYRDISSLGIGFPIHDDQRSEGFAFDDR